ncbi:phenylacetic acid degradation operon negative regulatory protein PaaX [Pseudomonas protegens]|jgi:phenylacetic acid degradation operon negative regulatory protein|uniref:Phenylacetic acid degradation operon negative regulatory protein PaaX n=3 Tax=Pseudomonas protegens TaxID=380021 RepID=Q4KBZ9_PSEF5|nr:MULTISPECIES: phenylacetic acid degradation operon negative regulatory protein PaaX [Pseudomonas]BCQ62267.1 phenylacetic acid degradation operon negative regulatory protein PaaX [Pseudomonas sp. Boi14]AAY92398.1 phenylacetic acid degradation operon negative regulatory protein PaaX [Pseudomonas protegens Pf-5]AGL84929.1 phenylacetic acid degradation operon negative regulatory protein PaaX [Pseudomonas protegens CHA0]APC21314.1 phenylacetic acid degradation operon negative regulatory protein P
MSSLAPLNHLIKRFQEQTPIRASSLIITLYGDAIEPHGGTVWLGSLIQLLEPMGINERLIRTSIFRLSKEGWLSAEKVGRRSYYSLTLTGRRRFDKAFKRVYSAGVPAWDGAWCLVMLSQLSVELRKQVREELEWQGFGAMSPVLLACPRSDRADINATLAELGAQEDTIVFETTPQDVLGSRALRLQVRESWNIDELAAHYSEFIQLFRPLWQALREQEQLQPQDCFLARLLLIHEYRKLLLRDPQLPDELLPGDWEGRAARQLCRNIYRLIQARAEEWLATALENADGPLPDVGESYYRRFGGLV